MIYLYSGTPGSGKSLHIARNICNWLAFGFPVICNFSINTDRVAHKGRDFQFIPNEQLTPEYLRKYSDEYFETKNYSIRKKEGHLKLVIDEAQLLFNARDWGRSGRDDWLSFFTQHRHLGYDIYLCAQFDRMLDRQIRSLIEYEYVHRKMGNYGWKGKIITILALGEIFVCVKIWYPMKERIGSELFRARKKYFSLYDTHVIFTVEPKKLPKKGRPPAATAQDGGRGAPAEAVAPEGVPP